MKRTNGMGPAVDAPSYEASEDIPTNPSTTPTMGDIIARRYGRRDVLRGALAVTAMTAVSGTALMSGQRQAAAATPGFDFSEIDFNTGDNIVVADGYTAQVLMPWGTPLKPDAPAFDPMNQSAAAQLQQVGYNHDFIGYVGLPFGSDNSENGILMVNHEYTNEELMFPGDLGRQDRAEPPFKDMTAELVDIEMAAHGGSVVEIRKSGNSWELVADSPYNRRITALDTEMKLSGPVAGHDRVKTSADASGTTAIGTFNNCAGGVTPWGTYLMAEENFHGYFMGELPEGHAEATNHERYGVAGGWYAWGQYHKRFDISQEPNEPNRFGWVVEVDVLDPTSTPVKRTAMGRAKHEGAETIVNSDGRVVAYMGDDQRFDYVYKFVTEGQYNPDDRAANRDLLDSGTLYVARFDEGGSLTWMPIVFGEGPLTAENGFSSQADVLIETRRAADLLGATPMDRPEDVEPNPVTNKVYIALTNNTRREAEQVNVANPRGPNPHGHIIELTPPDGDHAATTASWDILVQCGRMDVAEDGATFNAKTTINGQFGDPDNVAIDPKGRLWVSTDGNSPDGDLGRNDGVWSMETEGEGRATATHFFSVPVGAEMCGPRFTPDGRTLFVAIQHPAEGSSYSEPSTRFPDFDANMPVRPAVVVITKDDGGEIGG